PEPPWAIPSTARVSRKPPSQDNALSTRRHCAHRETSPNRVHHPRPRERSAPMHYGILMFATDYAIRPDELAIAAEARGFESLFFPEPTHIPASRRSPSPGGGELPKEYSHTHDLFVTLAAAAAVTTKIKIGAGICLVVERDPITTAKEVASLDVLSRGRLLF